MGRHRRFWLAGLGVAVLLAAVVSFYASSSPDGLEKVAADKGINTQQDKHGLSGSPLADYGTKGVDNKRLSGALAGLAGVGLTLLVGGALFLVVRRRGPAGAQADAAGVASVDAVDADPVDGNDSSRSAAAPPSR